MNSSHLLLRRLRQNWKYQYGIFKTVVDWTVMLYILIPSAAIILINYFSWWSEIPQWVETVSPSVVFVICFLFIWSGYFRTYVREADQIYLIKNRKLYLNLKLNCKVKCIFYY